jgi:antitoxin component of MazEF toxin-antitoxin module
MLFPMRTRVEKRPDGIAVVVPESLATQAGLRDGESVDVELAGGRLLESGVAERAFGL